MAFKEVVGQGGGEKFKFEKEGDTLEGHYMGSSLIEIQGKEVVKHTFKTATGILSPLGSADLNQKLEEVPVGALTRCTYLGKKALKGGKTVKTFKILVDEDNRIEVASAHADKSLS
jgi:hypothetical protein